MKKTWTVLAVLALGAIAPAYGDILTENFNAPFPAWESGWFGTNSNARNYYNTPSDRGNNPDGLWIQDNTPGDQNITIDFNTAFADTLTNLSMDVAGYTATNLRFFDANGVTLLNVTPITDTFDATTNPGLYVNYGVASSTGIGGFEFSGSGPEGNTSIDNLVAVTGESAVPEPTSVVLLATVLLAVAFVARKRIA